MNAVETLLRVRLIAIRCSQLDGVADAEDEPVNADDLDSVAVMLDYLKLSSLSCSCRVCTKRREDQHSLAAWHAWLANP